MSRAKCNCSERLAAAVKIVSSYLAVCASTSNIEGDNLEVEFPSWAYDLLKSACSYLTDQFNSE